MNTPSIEDDDAHEHEWQMQEKALIEERLGYDAANDDARVLRQPLPDSPPADFARSVVQQIEVDIATADQTSAAHEITDPFDAPFERYMLGALVALFGLGLGVVIALYAGMCVKPAVDAAAPLVATLKNPALLTFAACFALSSALQRWRRDPH